MKELASARVFTTSQLSQKLGIGTSMARRYGLVYEEVTGQALPQAPGKGRMYSEHVMKILQEARERLLSHPEETVEGALRSVLGIDSHLPEAPEQSQPLQPKLTAEVIKLELEQALRPLLAEIRGLREENQELREAVQGLRALTAPSGSSELSNLQKEHENLLKRHELLLEPPKDDRTGAERAPKDEPKRRWLAWLIERLQRWV